jgi:hypothetical protein
MDMLAVFGLLVGGFVFGFITGRWSAEKKAPSAVPVSQPPPTLDGSFPEPKDTPGPGGIPR